VHHDGLTTGDVTVATRTSSNRPFAQSIYAVPVALACALGLVAWLLLPSGESASLREKLGVKHSAAFGSTANPFGGKPGQRVPAAYTAGQLDLSLRGALPTDPVLRVPASSPELWRVQVFSVYDGRFWTARRQNPQLVSGGPVHTLPATQEVFDTKGFAREDVAEPLGPATDAPVWSPGLPMAVETRGQVIIDSVGVAHVLGIRQAPAYSVRSIAPEIEISQLRAASGADPSDPAWVTVPAVPERVRTLAKAITSGSSDRYTAMRKVESWLRGHILYDLDAPVPAAGKDSVDSMLFETHRGFCEHFASAEAVLLRTLGIPARVVSGLAGGNPSGSVPGTREFLADDAHAWVEVYFPGVGWVNSDPTAGAKLASAADEQNVVASVVASFRQMLNQLASMPGGRRTLGLMVAALVVLALLFGRRPRRAAVVRARRTTGRHGPVLVAFLTFEQRRRAQRERSVAESPREYVAATGELTALGEAVTVLEEECYGRRPPVGAVAVAAAAAFESATPVLPQP
jgi:transglutaminase-like putative cysteine protease